MKRKFLSILLALCMVMTLLPATALAAAPTATDSGYSDIDGHWAEESIKKWSEYGIFQGNNGQFDPNGELTRAQAAVIFMRLLNLTEEGDISSFTDVDPEAWYAEAIAKCVAAGIMLGNGDGTMDPTGKLTREQLFVMFGRALGVTPSDTCDKEFADGDSISSWAQGYINALVNMGAIDGMGDGSMSPDKNINRASIVALLDKCVTYVTEDGATVTADENTIVIVAAKNVTVEGNPAIVVNTTGESTEPDPDPTPSTPSTPSNPSNPPIIVPSHDHTFSSEWSKDETYHWHAATCEHTGETKDKAAHTWNDGVETTPATETSKGVKTYTCTVCGQTRTEDINELPHSHVWKFAAGHAATCKNPGKKDHYTCDCKAISLKSGDIYTVVADTDLAIAVDANNHEQEIGNTYASDDTQHWFTYPCCDAAGTKTNHSYDESTHKCVCGKADPDCVAKIGDNYYLTLAEAFAQVKRVGGGTTSYTIEILADIDLTGTDWTHPNDTNHCNITIIGNNHTIKGLNNSLLGRVGPAAISAKDLTFDAVNITKTGNTYANKGYAALIGYCDFSGGGSVTVDNCHVTNSTFDVYQWTGAFVGATDIPQRTASITIKNSSVSNSTFKVADGSCGAFVGYTCAGVTVENSSVLGTSIFQCTEDRSGGTAKAGSVIGTISHGKFVLNNVTVAETVTVTNVNATPIANKMIGRTVNGAVLTINGVQYISTAEALAAALTSDAETISVVLTADITLPIADLGTATDGSGQYKLGGENTTAINIDLNDHALTLSTTYMSALGAKNSGAVITVKNGSLTSTGNSVTTWDIYDLTFRDCKWNFEQIEFRKAVAIAAGANVDMKNVTITESEGNDYYALWITMEGQTVTLDGVTINCPSGRAIAIKNQYVTNPVAVNLTVKNSGITSAKKAAILVTNDPSATDATYTDEQKKVGATITLDQVNIAGVTADTTNAVWKDNCNTDVVVTVTGGTCVNEPS